MRSVFYVTLSIGLSYEEFVQLVSRTIRLLIKDVNLFVETVTLTLKNVMILIWKTEMDVQRIVLKKSIGHVKDLQANVFITVEMAIGVKLKLVTMGT